MLKILIILILCVPLCRAECDSFFGEIPSQFNTWMKGDFSCKNSETGGRLGAGGCVNIEDYSIGCNIREPPEGECCIEFGSVSCEELRGDEELEYSLVAGDNLSIKDATLFAGGLAYGGELFEKRVDIVCDCEKENCQEIDFEFWHDFLIELSEELTQLETCGLTEVSEDGAVTLKGQGRKDLEVFHVSGCDLEEATSLRLKNIDPEATVVIQVDGEDLHIGGFELRGFDCQNVLFNFYEAEKLIFCDIYWIGSVLAPYADFEDSTGVIDGQIFGNSWSSGDTCMQQNFCKFRGEVPEKSTRETKQENTSKKSEETRPHSPPQSGGDDGGSDNGKDGGSDNGKDGGSDNGSNNNGYNQNPGSSGITPVPIVAIPIADGSSLNNGGAGSGLSTGSIVGIAVGSFAFVALTSGLVAAFIAWRKGMFVKRAAAVSMNIPDVPAT